jgi:hypothetical protein
LIVNHHKFKINFNLIEELTDLSDLLLLHLKWQSFNFIAFASDDTAKQSKANHISQAALIGIHGRRR